MNGRINPSTPQELDARSKRRRGKNKIKIAANQNKATTKTSIGQLLRRRQV